MPRHKHFHVDSPGALAARLRAARERAGLSQRALARGICTPAYVSRLEKGERVPSLQLLEALAAKLSLEGPLDVTARELGNGTKPPEVYPVFVELGTLEQALRRSISRVRLADLDERDRDALDGFIYAAAVRATREFGDRLDEIRLGLNVGGA